jgi:integrase
VLSDWVGKLDDRRAAARSVE